MATVLEQKPVVPLGEPGELSIMDKEAGDLKVMWNRSNPEEVAIAKSQFDAARAKGMLTYKLGRDDQRGEVINTFDPAAERIVAIPRQVGG